MTEDDLKTILLSLTLKEKSGQQISSFTKEEVEYLLTNYKPKRIIDAAQYVRKVLSIKKQKNEVVFSEKAYFIKAIEHGWK